MDAPDARSGRKGKEGMRMRETGSSLWRREKHRRQIQRRISIVLTILLVAVAVILLVSLFGNVKRPAEPAAEAAGGAGGWPRLYEDSTFVDTPAYAASTDATNTLVNRMIQPVEGTLTSGFGARNDPITGVLSYHPAVDLAAPAGTPILVVLDGIVSDVGYNSIYGNYVKVWHNGRLQTMYSHCSAVLVETGDVVSQGDVVAKVGSTGYSTGNHLDFQVFIDGENVDPAPILGLTD